MYTCAYFFNFQTCKKSILIISHVGYKEKEVSIKNQSALNITLEEDKNELSQVVVIGYGAVKKSDLTGSVASIKADDLKAVPVTSFDQAMQSESRLTFAE